ncbi:CRISPR-associated endoribonuclease Cas6 [Aquifex sp.]
MPARIRLPLNFSEPISRNELTYDKLHGVFFRLFREDFAGELHKERKIKPYSLNFLVRNEETGKHENLFSSGVESTRRVIIEVNLMDDSLIPRFTYSYIFTDRDNLSLGNKKFIKGNLAFVETTSYKEIYSSSQAANKLLLRFITPTSFKSGKKVNILPEPKLIFTSLIKKWKSFSDLELANNLEKIIEDAVVLSGYELKTEKVDLGSMGWFLGFVGKIYMRFQTQDKEVLKWFNALLDFARFSGVGRKATMGFGVVRVFRFENS